MPRRDETFIPESRKTFRTVCFWLFGVLLPLVTLGIEIFFDLSAEHWFDPIPTPFHAALVAAVPLSFVAAHFALRHERVERVDALRFATGAAMGISLVFAIPYAPIMPIAVVGILVYGIGFLILSPLVTLIVAIRLSRRLNRRARYQSDGDHIRPFTIAGFCAAVLAVLLLAIPATMTQWMFERATEDDAVGRHAAMAWLRDYGSTSFLERACDTHPRPQDSMAAPLTWFGMTETPIGAAETYYRITGEECDAPEGWRAWNPPDEIDGMSMTSSDMETSIDADAATSYTEWTFEIENGAERQGEATMEVQLPPHSVVSRVSLWIDGEPREAAFAGKGRVTEAYEAVVAKSRDPILVNSSGPDRIGVRMFPVPAGGSMRARIGITSSASVGPDLDAYRLPRILKRNFDVVAEHRVDVSSNAAMSWLLDDLEQKDCIGTTSCELGLSEQRLTASSFVARPLHAARAASSWSGTHVVRREFVGDAARNPDHVVLVVDGSNAVGRHADSIAASLDALPDLTGATVVFAGDRVEVAAVRCTLHDCRDHLKSVIEDFDYGGGRDNAPALNRATRIVSGGEDAAVVWIHAPQQYDFGTPLEIVQGTVVAELQVAPGEDRIVESLHEHARLDAVPRAGTVGDDLERFLASMSKPQRRPIWTQSRATTSEATSDILFDLWAADRVDTLLRRGERERAIAVASEHRIVTPASGAVVLETQQQYRDHGLEPELGIGRSAAATPEPHEWAAIFVTCFLLMGAWVARRRRWRH